MENKKVSELLQKLSEVVDELHKLTDNNTKKSFIVLARDVEFDNSVHMIATSGSEFELSKNVFGLLALSHEREFVRAALEMYGKYLETKCDPDLCKNAALCVKNKHLN